MYCTTVTLYKAPGGHTSSATTTAMLLWRGVCALESSCYDFSYYSPLVKRANFLIAITIFCSQTALITTMDIIETSSESLVGPSIPDYIANREAILFWVGANLNKLK